MSKILKTIFLIVGTVYLFILITVYLGQRKFLYFPPNSYVNPATVGVDMQEIKYQGASGGMTAWYVPPQENTKITVMVFHGNASALYSNIAIFNDLRSAGYGVWSVGYPGYPGNAGNPSQQALVGEAVRQYDLLLSQGAQAEHIVFFGTSLGAAVAAQLTTQRKPGGMILNAPFNSAVDMGRMRFPFLPVGLLMRDKYRSDLALQTSTIPLLWQHGTDDRVIPIAQGQKLYDGYSGPKSANIIQGGHHNDLWIMGGREAVLLALTEIENSEY